MYSAREPREVIKANNIKIKNCKIPTGKCSEFSDFPKMHCRGF